MFGSGMRNKRVSFEIIRLVSYTLEEGERRNKRKKKASETFLGHKQLDVINLISWTFTTVGGEFGR